MHMASDAKAWTVDDLAQMPDDGQRYEIIDGELFMTPSPALRHQDAIARLLVRLASTGRSPGWPRDHRSGRRDLLFATESSARSLCGAAGKRLANARAG